MIVRADESLVRGDFEVGCGMALELPLCLACALSVLLYRVDVRW